MKETLITGSIPFPWLESKVKREKIGSYGPGCGGGLGQGLALVARMIYNKGRWGWGIGLCEGCCG